MTIRILLVDDHTLFRSGIHALLQRQSDFEIVGEAGDGLEGAKRARTLNPDLILLDLHMPGISGLEALRLITKETPKARVIMLTVSEEADDLVDCLRAGAEGYLLKNIDTDFLLASLRGVALGESVISPQMTAKLMASVRKLPPEAALTEEKAILTPRESEIISWLARGASNKELARTLNLAESTIKIHVQSILKKLKLNSRVQAAVYAVEHGMIGRS